jgi:hypothetical protein
MAVLVCRAQLTETDAATSTPPLLFPDLSEDVLFALSVESFYFGRLPSVLFCVFGLF